VRYELALAYRSLGRPADADAILVQLAAEPKGPVAADAQFLVGQAHLDAGRYPQAITVLERYLAANPDGEVADFALAHLAVARLGSGQLDLAWKALDDLARKFPQSKALATTRLRLAEAALAEHQSERAAEAFRLVADAGNTTVKSAQGSASAAAASVEPTLRVRALAGLGKALWDLGLPDKAAAAFAELLERAPNDPTAPEIALARGRALEASRDTTAALEAYDQAAHRYEKTEYGPRATVARARLLVKAGRPEEAAGAFEHLMGDEAALTSVAKGGLPRDGLLADWGSALLDAEKTTAADRVFSRLLAEYPASPHADLARFNLAESANQARHYAEVIRLLTPVVDSKPESARADSERKSAAGENVRNDSKPSDDSTRLVPAALYRLGRTRIELKDWRPARATLDRLVKDYPDSPYCREARFLSAFAALRGGEATAAEHCLADLQAEPAAKSDPPGFAIALRLRQIESWVVLKRWKDVLQAAEKLQAGMTVKEAPWAELAFFRGQALLALARLTEARTEFQRVVDLRRGGELEAQAQLMRGETYFHEDQLHEALREFLKVDILYQAPTWQAAALLEAGKVYERLHQWADAAETYERLLSRFPSAPSAADARQRLDAARHRTAAATAPGQEG
jgi:TolA-binding protein